MKLLLGHVLSDIYGGREEVTVVDLAVSIVIYLSYDRVELLLINFNALFSQDLGKLIHVDHTGAVRVDCFKLRSQIFHFILRNHLNEHIHSSPLKGRLTLEFHKSGYHLIINFLGLIRLFKHRIEPGVIDGLLAI